MRKQETSMSNALIYGYLDDIDRYQQKEIFYLTVKCLFCQPFLSPILQIWNIQSLFLFIPSVQYTYIYLMSDTDSTQDTLANLHNNYLMDEYSTQGYIGKILADLKQFALDSKRLNERMFQAKERELERIDSLKRQTIDRINHSQKINIDRINHNHKMAIEQIDKDYKANVQDLYARYQEHCQRIDQRHERITNMVIESNSKTSKIVKAKLDPSSICIRCSGKERLVLLGPCQHRTCLLCIGDIQAVTERNPFVRCSTCRYNYQVLIEASISTMNAKYREAARLLPSDFNVDLNLEANKVMLRTMTMRINQARREEVLARLRI